MPLLRMQPQPAQPSQPAYPPHLKVQGVEPGRAVSEDDDLPAGPASSTTTEDVLHEAEARSLAANLEGIDQEWRPQNGKVHDIAHPDSSPAAKQPAATPEQQEPAHAERNSSQNGTIDRQLTYRGIVFDLETTGAVFLPCRIC